MNDQFADNVLKDWCFKLDFRYFFDRTIKYQMETKTLLSVIEKWLWDYYRIRGSIKSNDTETEFIWMNYAARKKDVAKLKSGLINETGIFVSPIRAKEEGLKLAVEWIFKNKIPKAV